VLLSQGRARSVMMLERLAGVPGLRIREGAPAM
jgi:hypothetical protein